MNDLHALFLHELKDIYDAEHRILEALGPMIQAAKDPEAQAAFEEHRRETEEQIGRLKRVFQRVGEEPKRAKCHGVLGLLEERNSIAQERPDPAILDVAQLAGGMKVERYEITSYESLIHLATKLNMGEAVDLLGENLAEEHAMLGRLQGIAGMTDMAEAEESVRARR